MIKVNQALLAPPTYYGESDESKPTTDVEYASKFIEIDTSKTYFFDGSEWNEWIPTYKQYVEPEEEEGE